MFRGELERQPGGGGRLKIENPLTRKSSVKNGKREGKRLMIELGNRKKKRWARKEKSELTVGDSSEDSTWNKTEKKHKTKRRR